MGDHREDGGSTADEYSDVEVVEVIEVVRYSRRGRRRMLREQVEEPEVINLDDDVEVIDFYENPEIDRDVEQGRDETAVEPSSRYVVESPKRAEDDVPEVAGSTELEVPRDQMLSSTDQAQAPSGSSTVAVESSPAFRNETAANVLPKDPGSQTGGNSVEAGSQVGSVEVTGIAARNEQERQLPAEGGTKENQLCQNNNSTHLERTECTSKTPAVGTSATNGDHPGSSSMSDIQKTEVKLRQKQVEIPELSKNEDPGGSIPLASPSNIAKNVIGVNPNSTVEHGCPGAANGIPSTEPHIPSNVMGPPPIPRRPRPPCPPPPIISGPAATPTLVLVVPRDAPSAQSKQISPKVKSAPARKNKKVKYTSSSFPKLHSIQLTSFKITNDLDRSTTPVAATGKTECNTATAVNQNESTTTEKTLDGSNEKRVAESLSSQKATSFPPPAIAGPSGSQWNSNKNSEEFHGQLSSKAKAIKRKSETRCTSGGKTMDNPPKSKKKKSSKTSRCPLNNDAGWVKEDEWEIEGIVDYKCGKNGDDYYKVKWLGWPEEHNSWLSEKDFTDPGSITKYLTNLNEKANLLNEPAPVREGSAISSVLVYLRPLYD